MKTVQPLLLRGLLVPALFFPIACSGTQADAAPEAALAAPDASSGRAPGESSVGTADASHAASRSPTSTGLADGSATQQPQEPQTPQEIQRQRRDLLIQDSLKKARRAVEMKLWKDALREAGTILEFDPGNDEARTILLNAQEVLGTDETAKVAREFEDKALQMRITQERDRFRATQEMQQGDALVSLGRYGDALEHFDRALLILRFSPMIDPGSTLERSVERKLESAQQSQAQALQDQIATDRAQSRRELDEAERREQLARAERVKRLVVQANQDFQLGNFTESVQRLDQALIIEPNNSHALALRDLAGRARHENRLEVVRARWKAEWSSTFQELQETNIPQTDVLQFDLARWAEVSQRKPLEFTKPAEFDSPEERAIRKRLAEVVIEHNFASASVQDWSQYYQKVTDVNFVVGPGVIDLPEESTTLTDFSLPRMSVQKALNVIGDQTGVRWRVQDGVVQLVGPDVKLGKTYLYPYEVRDLVLGVPNKPGPELKLRVPGEEDLLLDLDEEPAPTVVDEGKLQDLIRNNIAPDTWDGEPGTLSYHGGVLLVRHTAEVQEQVKKLLADLRRAVGIQVDVEARFLRVADQFLEDIGVDFRGLGNNAAEGVPGRGLSGGQNPRFDDFGRPETITPASPGEIGTGTEPGIYFDDGQDGDYLGRTENLFDTTLGGRDNQSISNAGGLSMQMSFLDDTELEIVLRAVQKQERSESIVAPRLLIYNNTRASMQALRHTSYISDFDVEIAQAAAVANPIVDVVRDGVVLDVRPVVSADRRFITMELRPTVLELQTPIPTFTTTLGAGNPVSIQLPTVRLQRVRTIVTMPDGGTLMLGGQKIADRQSQESGVPILKDIPILSFFFSRKGTYTNHRKLFVLLRARIIIDEEWEPTMIPDDFDQLLRTAK